MNFQKTNNITGWFVFAVALLTYWLTMEETASYWDCGEFISVAYKLEVPHPPGAPLFLLIGRIFSFLAFGDVTMVAYWVNFSSILAAAFTILFLFWSITLFGRKLLKTDDNDLEQGKGWVLIGGGLVGALSCIYSDSFWFSAVEGEVYAMSGFFTAFVVWAMLKWDVIEDQSKANRWLILIFYMMGLSIGVHLLNLVTIPALGLIYYFKKYETPTLKGIGVTMLISLFLIVFINDFIIPGLPTIAGSFEVFFVNSLSLPFGSGAIFFTLVVIAALVYGIRYTHKNKHTIFNSFLLSTAFILIGYSSYALIVIRSVDNPPINENDPSDVMSFVRYLKREQYGSRPLFYGQYFTAQVTGYEEGAPIYAKGEDKYEVVSNEIDVKYERPGDNTFFPRIYSTEPNHKRAYQEKLQITGRPDFGDNLAFMFSHQIGWMYVRYFMFNFAGRESDLQDANWLRPWTNEEIVPTEIKENEGRNNYWMIPLLLGLLGLVFQLYHDPKNFAVVGLLFILTGVALVVYLNSPPIEPRERDYIYTGSYYTFCMWIGFAVIALAEFIRKYIKSHIVSAALATVFSLSAPAIMAAENWDDHDRSNRFYSVDSANNYLQSCAPNAVLFTGGDNDTFPLWYAQEVEGIRTDVRVVVLSYYNTDWYIKQTMRQTYESEPFPYTLTGFNYRQHGPNNYLRFVPTKMKQPIDLKTFLKLLRDEELQYQGSSIIPTRDLSLKVNVDEVKAMGIVPKDLEEHILSEMILHIKGPEPGQNGYDPSRVTLEKKDLAMLDLLATSDWKRPIYVNKTSLSQFKIDLEPYIIQEGNAYRIVPVRNPNPGGYMVNTDLAYKNMTEKFRYRELDNPDVYYNEDYDKFAFGQRLQFIEVARAFIEEKNLKKAADILNFALEKMPDEVIHFNEVTGFYFIDVLMEVGEKEKAFQLTRALAKRLEEMIAYGKQGHLSAGEVASHERILVYLMQTMYKNGETTMVTELEEIYQKYTDPSERQPLFPEPLAPEKNELDTLSEIIE